MSGSVVLPDDLRKDLLDHEQRVEALLNAWMQRNEVMLRNMSTTLDKIWKFTGTVVDIDCVGSMAHTTSTISDKSGELISPAQVELQDLEGLRSATCRPLKNQNLTKLEVSISGSQHRTIKRGRQLEKKTSNVEEHHGAIVLRSLQRRASRLLLESQWHGEQKRYKTQRRKWHPFRWHQTLSLFFAFLMAVGMIPSLLLLKKPNSGDWLEFGPRKTLRVKTIENAIYLAISRLTAYMMYPCVILVFTTKARSFHTWLAKTPASLYFPFFERDHDLHVRAGWFCFALTYLHAVCHVIRWTRLSVVFRHDTASTYLYSTQTGRTGFIGWVCVTLVCLPFGLDRLRRNIRWEFRKPIHCIGGLGFVLSGAWHAPATNIFFIYLPVACIYAIDWIYGFFFKTFEVETCHFSRLHDSVVLSWKNPDGFNQQQHGYVNICIPWVNKYEWHAFAVYPSVENDAVLVQLHEEKEQAQQRHDHKAISKIEQKEAELKETHASLIIAKTGDWTSKLHELTEWKTTRPVWIQGPFVTPFSAASNYDNVIAVSTGSGISACLAAEMSLKHHRRISIVWLCRDPSMVEFYLRILDFPKDAFFLIYYTGKQKLLLFKKLPRNVFIFHSRPNLRNVVAMIIHSIEAQVHLPEEFLDLSEDHRSQMYEAYEAHRSSIISANDTPMQYLRHLLGNSLQAYKMDELMLVLDGPEEFLTVEDLHELLIKITHGGFPPEALPELAEHFYDGDGKISRSKIIHTCREYFHDYMAYKDSATETEEIEDMLLTDSVSSVESFIEDLQNNNAMSRLRRWLVCYCGSCSAVSKELDKCCSDFFLAYKEETYSW